jgi:hypothetical protein
MVRGGLLAAVLCCAAPGAASAYGDTVPEGIEIVLDADGIEHTSAKGEEFIVAENGKVADNWVALTHPKGVSTLEANEGKVVLRGVEVSALPLPPITAAAGALCLLRCGLCCSALASLTALAIAAPRLINFRSLWAPAGEPLHHPLSDSPTRLRPSVDSGHEREHYQPAAQRLSLARRQRRPQRHENGALPLASPCASRLGSVVRPSRPALGRNGRVQLPPVAENLKTPLGCLAGRGCWLSGTSSSTTTAWTTATQRSC